jgi:hypothetical protein
VSRFNYSWTAIESLNQALESRTGAVVPQDRPVPADGRRTQRDSHPIGEIWNEFADSEVELENDFDTIAVDLQEQRDLAQKLGEFNSGVLDGFDLGASDD